MHSGHRERLREKFLKGGAEALEEHELLELILFYSIPRKNTNELAHSLISRFGSLRGVLDASSQSLMAINGIGPGAALHIKLIGALIFRYNLSGSGVKQRLDSYSAVSDFVCGLFVGETEERVFAIMLNNSLGLIGYKAIGTGGIKLSMAHSRELLEDCIFSNAAYVIIAHNHPEGVALPSGMDVEATQIFHNALRYAGIDLIDHFVVAGGRCTPILRGGSECAEESFDRAIEEMTGRKR